MDVDIDLKTDFDPMDYFPMAVRASMIKENDLVKHPAGAYFQSMHKDKVTGLAAIPYDRAEELGYFKVDFLHLSVLNFFDSKEEIRELSKIPPDWALLESAVVVKKLFQLHRHYDLVQQVKPRSVEELADCIALIRPGKRKLIAAYLKNKTEARKFLYRKEENEQYSFKKSHAIAYALTIVLQLHLIKGGIL